MATAEFSKFADILSAALSQQHLSGDTQLSKLDINILWAYQAIWPASWETCMQVRKQQLELDMEQQTGSK